MKCKSLPEEEIYRSWKNCARSGVSPDLVHPANSINKQQLQAEPGQYRFALAAFSNTAGAIAEAFPPDSAFLLTDARGTLIKKNN